MRAPLDVSPTRVSTFKLYVDGVLVALNDLTYTGILIGPEISLAEKA